MPPKVSEVEGCNGCPMQRLFPDNNFVSPFLVKGDRLCVAEAPGQTESERGEPLVGTSGSWLFGKEDENGRRSGGLYKAAGVDTSTVSKCNVINCQPPHNVFPTDSDAKAYISKEEGEAAVRQCLHNHVKPILESREWKRLDLLGEKSLRYLAGVEGGILKFRGSVVEVDTDKL